MTRAVPAPKNPARELVKIRAVKIMREVIIKASFNFCLLIVSAKVITYGTIKTRYDASQLGWPSVENIRRVGAKAFCQQEDVNFPVITKHEGSRPKWAGIPQRETIKAVRMIASNNFFAFSKLRLTSAK